jgi:hypothetical protein
MVTIGFCMFELFEMRIREALIFKDLPINDQQWTLMSKIDHKVVEMARALEIVRINSHG